jgi:hypothetical protein
MIPKMCEKVTVTDIMVFCKLGMKKIMNQDYFSVLSVCNL